MNTREIEELRWAVNDVEKAITAGFDRLIEAQDLAHKKLLEAVSAIDVEVSTLSPPKDASRERAEFRKNVVEALAGIESDLNHLTASVELKEIADAVQRLVSHFMPPEVDHEFPVLRG